MGIFGDILSEVGRALPGLASEVLTAGTQILIGRIGAKEQQRTQRRTGAPPSISLGGPVVQSLPFVQDQSALQVQRRQFLSGLSLPPAGGIPVARGPIQATPAGFGLGGEPLGETLGICPDLFRPTRTSIRAASLVMVRHPQTGEPVFFKHAGRPILFSGDLAVAKRVRRLAARARRASR